MTSNSGRTERLDQMLTGLAMLDAYTARDTDSLKAMVDATPPGEAVESLLATMEAMCGIFAASKNLEPAQVTDSVRRRIVRELATSTGPTE